VLPILPQVSAPPATDAATTAGGEGATLFYAGAIAPMHIEDFGILLSALATLRDGGRKIVLSHAGRVLVDRDALLASAGLTADAVVFHGHVPQGALDALLKEADVLVQPGAPSEFNRLRLPSKLQAYLPSGTPTVTFAAGFGELLEDGSEVLKTHTADPQELADAVSRVLDDRSLAAVLAAGGPRAAQRLFDPVRNTDALEAHYRDHLAS
jgi:glycosyltransferase involved in cell wall biosynthesis